MPRLRSRLTAGLADAVTALRERNQLPARPAARRDGDGVDAKLDRIEKELAALRSLIIATDEHAQRKLKAGLASAVNLISILPQLKIDGVLPPFPHRGFEVTGELAVFLFHLVRRHRPKLIVELGCGSSTVLFAAALRANGGGRIISVEHDREHLERTAQYLRQTELLDWVEPREAPLVEQRFGALSLQWYDVGPLLAGMPDGIDLLFVDGPPGRLQTLSRYPALPVLYPYLSQAALVVVDDGRREDETRMIELWRELDIAFESEALGFLPRAPVLLTMGVSEAQISALRRERNQA